MENLTYYGLIALALAAVFAVGFMRDLGTEQAIRRYAERHGMEFQPRELLKGVKTRAAGNVGRWKVSIGEAIVERYTKGIAPTVKGVELEARLELPEGVRADPARLEGFLREGGGILDQSLVVYFPKRWFSSIADDEIEQAVARLQRAAEELRPSGR